MRGLQKTENRDVGRLGTGWKIGKKEEAKTRRGEGWQPNIQTTVTQWMNGKLQ